MNSCVSISTLSSFVSFEGVCLNYRHPGPRRVIREGPSDSLWHHFRWLCQLCRLPRLRETNSKLLSSITYIGNFWPPGAPARCFFDFLRDASHEMICFGTIFRRMLPKPIVSRETSLNVNNKKRCAIFKFSFRLRETRLCLNKSCLVYSNETFNWEAEAKALGRPRPAKTLTWHKSMCGRQTNVTKF